ncbi:MAG: SusC/RagA family TonB-linked outer membrane protein [Cyclobacteriaceae bacterium]|nr:SusC/RagA family TonB-linked outer membrane protein [Cyclobacteriaceae bacterium]
MKRHYNSKAKPRNFILTGNRVGWFCTVLLLSITLNSFAQERIVRGKVTSAEDDSAIPGANIILKGTSTGAVTDGSGNYSISLPQGGGTLIFSFIGFQGQEVEVGTRTEINVRLNVDVTQLSEVVVTSFGIEKSKQSLGYAVQSVGGKELTEVRQPNIVSALQGQVAGVQITNTGGGPGMGARIVVRGLTSLNAGADNQPLFIVDGVPIDNQTFDNGSFSRGMSNRAADINPNDIENISILKGAAATGLYGVRAANGAVVITTKSGKSGKSLTINVGSSFSADKINKLPEFQKNYGRGWYGIDDGSVYSASGALIEAQSVVDPTYVYYDNYNNFFRTGGTRDSYFNISGGNDVFTFYTSVNNTDQKGIIPFSDWGRTTARLRATAKFNEKFNIEASVNYSNSGGNRVPHTTMGERLMYWSHTQDITQYMKPDGTQIAGILSANPLYNARFLTYGDNVDRTISNLTFNYKPIEWLQFTYRFGHDFYVDKRDEIVPGPQGIAGENLSGLSATGYMEQRRFINRVINSNFIVTFDKKITPDLNATVRLGHELFERDLNYSYTYGGNFVTPFFYSFTNVTEHRIEETNRRSRLVGAFGDATFDYKNFLYLNLTARNDWTSTLPKGNNSFFYPSASLSFVFNDVLNLPSQLSYGKIRAAWGQVGKDTEPYRTAATYAKADAFPLNNRVGYVRSGAKGSDQLVPEMTTTLEFGTELKFFENKLGVDLTWYKANSKDQILAVPVSNTTGYGSLWINAGEIENKGIELTLTGTPLQLGDFRWDAMINFTRNRNMVVDIAEGVDDILIATQSGYLQAAVAMRITNGQPYGDLYGTAYQRYYAGGEPDGVTHLDRNRPLLIGANGFPTLTPASKQLVLGNAMPDWLTGIRNTFTYKNVSLSFLVDVRWGNDQYDQYGNWLAAFLKPDFTNDRNDVVVFDGVLADGTPNTQQVWLGQGLGPDGRDYGAGYYRNIHRAMSENFVYDASFVKLRNVTLNYNLPKSWLTPLSLKAVSVSGSINNIILWTPWRNYDPESYSTGAGSNATGLAGMGYPGARSALFSINITL